MATAEQTIAEIDGRIERRLETEVEAHEAEIEAMGKGERMLRHTDLDGDYVKPESRFAWGEEDKTSRQLATVAEWPLKEVRSFREELQSIEEDGRYSDEHKEQLKPDLAREYLEADAGHAERGGRLVRTDFHANKIQKRVRSRREELTPFDPPEPETANYSAQREREIRAALAAEEDANKRLEMAERLVDSGDPEAVRAVVNPPAGTSPLTPPNVKLLRKRALKNRYGDNALEELGALDGMAELVRHNLQEARSEIARLGGLQ